jgi:hypothetical protein
VAWSCGFVENVGDTTFRLNLSAGPWVVTPESQFPPPPPRRVGPSTMLGTNGDPVAATKYGNRVLQLRLRYDAGFASTAADTTATFLRSLHAELVRSNVLLVKFGTTPIWFRTFPAPDYTIDMLRGLADLTGQSIDLIAEPFALGAREQLGGGTITINNDPVNATNPQYVDLSSVKGDVETPLYITSSTAFTSGGAPASVALAVRAHGIPANGVYVMQAESLSMGTNTAVVADANYSGGSLARTTFANTNDDVRLTTLTAPGTVSATRVPEFPGTYRVFTKLTLSSPSTTTVKVRMAVQGVLGPQVTLALTTAEPTALVDLGTIQLPHGSMGSLAGYGAVLGAGPLGLDFYAQRTAGAGNLDWDYFLFLPADESLAQVTFPTTPTGTYVFDGPNDQVYIQTSTGGVDYVQSATSLGFVDFRGAVPSVAPGQVNRLWFVRMGGAIAGGGSITALSIYYWPRWIWINSS